VKWDMMLWTQTTFLWHAALYNKKVKTEQDYSHRRISVALKGEIDRN
jgi:hypothetical protein